MAQTARPDGAPTAVYVISIAARLAGVHPQTLRIYERKGLLDPERTGGGSRRYSDDDIAQLQRINALTDAGVNLEGVRRILALEAQISELKETLDAVRVAANDAVQRAHRQYRREIVPVRPAQPPVAIARRMRRS